MRAAAECEHAMAVSRQGLCKPHTATDTDGFSIKNNCCVAHLLRHLRKTVAHALWEHVRVAQVPILGWQGQRTTARL